MTQHQRLAGRVAIVTGASREIGAAAAEAYAREGAAVAVGSFPSDAMMELAHEVVARITDAGGRAIVVPVDLADPSQISRMVETTRREFGDIDVLVNNAAYETRTPWQEMSIDQWDYTMDVNVRGSFLCAQAVYPGMLRAGRGSIINLTSVTVELGMAGFLDYVTSKAGLIGLTRALAREVGPDGIRVNAVMPGMIRTVRETSDLEASLNVAKQRQSLPRRGYPDDLTGAFVFLASDDSAFVTGQVINVDGGWMMY